MKISKLFICLAGALLLVGSSYAQELDLQPQGIQVGVKTGFISKPLQLDFLDPAFPATSISIEYALTESRLWDDKFSLGMDITLGRYQQEEGFNKVTIGGLAIIGNVYPLNFIKNKKPEPKFKIMPSVGLIGSYDYALVNGSLLTGGLFKRFFIGGKGGVKIGMDRFVFSAEAGYMPQAMVQFGVGYMINKPSGM